MNWLWIAVAALSLGGASRALAEKPERLLDVGGTFVGQTENTDNDVDTETQRSTGWMKLKLPVPIGGGNALLFGLSYQGQFVSYDKFKTRDLDGGPEVDEGDLPENLHAIDFTLGFVWKMTQDWSTVVQFMPGIHSDMEDVTGDDWLMNGSLLFVRPYGKAGRFGIGAAFSDAFGKPMPLPLLLIDWYPAENWFVEGLLPTDLDIGYRFSKAFSMGLEAKVRGYMYRLTEDDPWNDAVLRYTEVQVGPFVDYSVTDKFHLRASAGVSGGQKFEIRDDDNDEKFVDGDYDNAGYATINLYYTF